MLPQLLPQLGNETMLQLRQAADITSDVKAFGHLNEDDDVPTLVGDFDEPSKNEVSTGNEIVASQGGISSNQKNMSASFGVDQPFGEPILH